jgi:hypothetical protein
MRRPLHSILSVIAVACTHDSHTAAIPAASRDAAAVHASSLRPDSQPGTSAVVPADRAPLIFVANQDSSRTLVCFAAPELGLAPGTPVTIVYPSFPQGFAAGTLGARSTKPCFPAPPSLVDTMEYTVMTPADTSERDDVPIVIVGRAPVAEMRGDTVTLLIEREQTRWRFRACASEEGIHTTAWSGVPLASPRRWHAYYYVGYDLEPNCAPGDYEPDSALR